MSEQSVRQQAGRSITKAVEVIKSGGVVGFPTETFYGLAVDPFCPEAVHKLFRIKRRSSDKPLLLLISQNADLVHLVKRVPVEFLPLMHRFWPGPLTLIFPAVPILGKMLTGNTGTIGVRISSHPIATEFVKQAGIAVTATSANRSGKDPAIDAAGVSTMFGNEVDYILDGGKTTGGAGSTIVLLENSKFVIIREGAIPSSLIFQGK